SSRRRHTRFSRDWSSDVCSSDLGARAAALRGRPSRLHADHGARGGAGLLRAHHSRAALPAGGGGRAADAAGNRAGAAVGVAGAGRVPGRPGAARRRAGGADPRRPRAHRQPATPGPAGGGAAAMIRITGSIAIDPGEIEESFLRAGGPGGQNVNKVASAVQLRFDLRHSPSLPAALRARAERLAGRRLTKEGVLVITANRFRSQERNRADALERLV